MAKWVLDAGHGGCDQGVIGKLGIKESDIVLQAVLEAKRLLQKNGEQVLLTREVDEGLDQYRRAEIANEWNGDYFISVHMNSSSDTSVTGTEIFVLSYGTLAEKIASQIKSELVAALKSKDRGVKEANYIVLRNTKMPAILIEGEFLSNVNIEKEFTSKLYGYYIAKGCLALVDKVIIDLPEVIQKPIEFRGWRVCLGAYKDFSNAENSLNQLKTLGYDNAYLVPYEL